MSDSWFSPLVASGILGGTSPSSVQALRQKIALAMLMQKRKAPSNFGEGLSAIGDALGERATMQGLTANAAAQSAQTDREVDAINRGTTPGAISDAVVPDPAKVASAPLTPDVPAQPTTTATTKPMFRPPPGTVGRPPAGTEVSEGNYGYSPPPPYLAAALERNVPDPERRAYLGHLAGKEARSANEVSPTGAAGPFQFTRGTGAAYGIPGNARFDQDASIGAVNKLTDDNAAVLGKALGRPPTGPELALAHQQGAGTAAKMLLGTGNASARNLAVNNASGGPQAAAQKIMSYYAMPGGPGGPRDEAAAVLAARQPPSAGPAGPQDALLGEVTGMTGPTSALGFAPTASAGRIGDVTSDMPSVTGAMGGPAAASVADSVQQRQQGFQQPQAAPPAGPQLAQAGPFPPPTLDASGRPAAIIPGGGLPQVMQPPIPAAPQDPRAAIRKAPLQQPDEYVAQDRPMPPPPRKPGPGPAELKYAPLLSADVDERVKNAARLKIEQERAVRGADYEEALKSHDVQKADWLKEQEQNRLYRQKLPGERATTRKTTLDADEKEIQLGGLPEKLAQERRELEAKVGKAQADAQVAQQNAAFQTKVGREREPFLKEFATEKAQVEKVSGLLRNANAADEAIKSGDVIWGSGADAKLALARVGSSLGNKRAAEIAAASEKYRHASESTLGYGIMLVNGKDPRVTDADIQQAKGLTGTLDMQRASQQRIINAMREDLRGKVANYEDVREQYLRGDPQHRFFKVDTPPTAPPDQVDVLLKYRDNPQAIATFNRDHGPGAAELEIKRALRREERARKISREDD